MVPKVALGHHFGRLLGPSWDPKSPKKGSKTPKDHVQDNIRTNSIFNRKAGWPQANQDLRQYGPEVVIGRIWGPTNHQLSKKNST